MNPEPYVGPRPFTIEDRSHFFGRKEEVDETVSFVMSHPVTLIYARSGVGKGSLVHAGLVPMLRDEGYAVLPPARVEGVVPEGIDPGTIDNPYIFHALGCWLDEQEVPFCAPEEVVKLRLGAFVDAWMKVRPPALEDAPPVLIFEEIITSYEARGDQRDEFFAQLGEAIRLHPELKIVLTVREEFVAVLEPFAKYFPRQLRIRKRLELLTPEAALLAITRPVVEFGVRYAEGVAEKLVHDLLGLTVGDSGEEVRGEFVEPVQLQVVCRNLWEKLPDDFKTLAVPGAAAQIITQAHLEAAGEVTAALSNYYNDAIQASVAASGVAEGALRRWFGETLIAPDRLGLGMAVKGQPATAAMPDAAIRVLIEKYLIRHEKRSATEWYELAQARFIQPILRSNDGWLKQRAGPEAIRRELERRAATLISTGESLKEWEIGQAENFLKSPEARELGEHDAIRALVQRSREQLDERRAARERELQQEAVAALQARRLEEQARSIRRQRLLLAGVAVMAALAVWQWVNAVRQTKIAKARELAFRALDDIRRDPERALLLALHSFSERPTSEGVNILHQTLAASPIRLRLAGEQGHRGSVTASAYSPDGNRIVTGGADGRVLLWDARHGGAPQVVSQPEGTEPPQITSVAFSPDGSTLAAARRDGKVLLWPVPAPPDGPWPEPRVLTHLRPGTQAPAVVRTVAFDRTGARLITAATDGTARVWDVASGQETLRLLGHDGDVRSAAFSPTEDQFAVTSGKDGFACLWDLNAAPELDASGLKLLRTPWRTPPFKSEGDRDLWDAQFSPDGKRFVTAGADHVARVWDVGSTLEVAVLDTRLGAAIFQAKFLDPDTVVTVSADKTARIWRLEELPAPETPPTTASGAAPLLALIGTTVSIIRGHSDWLRSVAVRPDRKEIVTTSRDGTARVWSLLPSMEVAAVASGAPAVWSAAFRPDGKQFAMVSARTVEVWETDDFGEKAPLFRLPDQPAPVRHVCYSPDGRRFATADRKGLAKIWDATSGAELSVIPGVFRTVAFHPDGRHLAGTGKGNSGIVVDLESGTATSLEGHSDSLMSLAFSPDGRHIVTTSLDGHVKITSWETRALVADYGLENSDISVDAAFSPDGQRVVIAWGDGRASVWDWAAPAGGSPRASEIRANEGQVRRVLFFHQPADETAGAVENGRDGLRVITAGFDGSVRIWQEDAAARSWVSAYQLPGATGPVYGLDVTPDGSRIFTGGTDRVGRMYYTDPAWLCDLAKRRVTRSLTDEERVSFGIDQKDGRR